MKPTVAPTPLVIVSLLFGASMAFGQGPLTPPGAPGPTMKTLDQIEARTPIPGGTDPFTIAQSGSYYLTGNLTSSGGDLVTVSASDVTLDLNGYSLLSTADPAAGTAITISPDVVNVTIRNGHIHGPGTVGAGGSYTGGGFVSGVRFVGSAAAENLDGGRVSDLSIAGCSRVGIDLGQAEAGSAANVVERCTLRQVGSDGISASVVRGCSVVNAGGNGIRAEIVEHSQGTTLKALNFGITATTASNCTGQATTGIGLYAKVATSCQGASGGTGLSAITAVNCRGEGGTGYGLYAQTATDCSGQNADPLLAAIYAEVATGCKGVSFSNASRATGLQADVATNCVGIANVGTGLNSNTATNCAGETTSGSYGLLCAGTATGCRGKNPGSTGIAIQTGLAIGCTTSAGRINASGKFLGTP